MTGREDLINKLADEIEQSLREAILKGPDPWCFTRMDVFCEVCMQYKSRCEVRLIVEDPNNSVYDRIVCNDCIKKKGIKVEDSPRSLEFEARTVAIQRIKYGSKNLFREENRI